jgi:hypothetical protein
MIMTTTAPQLHPLVPPGPFDLEALLEFEPPTRWRPEPGEKVIGELVRTAEKTSFGRAAPTLYLLVDDRYVTVRASGVVLRGALDELRPNPGEPVAIKFEGMRTSAAGHQYALYRLAVKRAGSWKVAQ